MLPEPFWPDERQPFASELVTYYSTLTPTEKLEFMEQVGDNSRKAAVCQIQAHDEEIKDLVDELGRSYHRGERYRQAWESARRRTEDQRRRIQLLQTHQVIADRMLEQSGTIIAPTSLEGMGATISFDVTDPKVQDVLAGRLDWCAVCEEYTPTLEGQCGNHLPGLEFGHGPSDQ